MPTVSEIIQDVDERMPNRFPVETKIRWLNSFQRTIFRQLDLPGVHSFRTMENVGLYDLPKSCSIDLIDEVVFDGLHLDYKSLQQEAVGQFYYSVAGQIGIYPPPKEAGQLVTIFYKKRPETLELDRIEEQVPELTEDYHELLKLHLFITMAKANEDAALANAYTYDLNELILNLKMDLIDQEPTFTHTRDVMGGRGSYVSEEVGS